MAIATRFLLGALNGLLGPMKVSTAWGIGLIIGPALGGYLALPAEKYPNIFSPDSLFGRFPYFLPCLCTSVFAAIVLISCIWMPVLCIPILFAYPYMTYLSGPGLSIVLNIASVIKNNLGVTIITGTFILQNNAVPQNQRGAANGLAMTGMSFFKAIAPAGAGIVFSWAQKRQHAFFFPGDQMVFFLLNIIELLGLVLTFRPFLAVPEQYERN
uniref:Major facilitator superfamily (MFS) profile domain-containing protein n=1 Tax=Aegilops tauschii subsp. strangulata TaxID=200361 RepID=A0A453HQB6_AEGTS